MTLTFQKSNFGLLQNYTVKGMKIMIQSFIWPKKIVFEAKNALFHGYLTCTEGAQVS